MSQIALWLDAAYHALCAAGQTDSPKLDAQLLLAHCLKQNRTYLYTYPKQSLSADVLTQADALLAARQQGKPIAYLLGETEFWGLKLKVNEQTLIPRADTETLVEWALELNLPTDAKVLDLGTGTGAIALALAQERPRWHITGVDYLPPVVALACCNQARHQLKNVQFKQSNWYADLDEHYDLIVANPPYIAAQDIHLSQGDVRFEPHSALVAEQQGLADLQHIIQHAPSYLTASGWLLVEHGYDQAAKVQQLFTQACYHNGQQRKDLGNHVRVTGGQNNG